MVYHYSMKKNVVLFVSACLLMVSCFSMVDITPRPQVEKTVSGTDISQNAVPQIAVILPNKNNPDDPVSKDVMIGVNRLAHEFNGVIEGTAETVEFGKKVTFRIFQTDGGSDYEAAQMISSEIAGFGLQAFDLVIGAGYQYGLPFYYLNEMQGIKQFIVLDMISSFSISNILEVVFDVGEAAFIAGAVAAERFSGESLGVIGDLDHELINTGFVEPFIDGVEYMDYLLGTYTDVIVKYPDDFNNNREIYRLAAGLYKNGVKCIYQVTAAGDITDAAINNNGWLIGCNLDQGLEAALHDQPYKHILTSTQKKWGNGIYLVCREYLTTGNLPKTIQTVGLKEDCVDVSINPYNTPVLGSQADTIRELKEAIITGNLESASIKVKADRKDIWKSLTKKPPSDALTITVDEPVMSPGIPEHYGPILRKAIFTGLINSGSYNVIDREQVNRLLTEIRFSMEGIADDSRQLEIGRLAAAQAVVFVSLEQVGEEFSLDCKLVDVETGLSLGAARNSYPDFENALNSIGLLLATMGE